MLKSFGRNWPGELLHEALAWHGVFDALAAASAAVAVGMNHRPSAGVPLVCQLGLLPAFFC
jgi:hypothetical protein